MSLLAKLPSGRSSASSPYYPSPPQVLNLTAPAGGGRQRRGEVMAQYTQHHLLHALTLAHKMHDQTRWSQIIADNRMMLNRNNLYFGAIMISIMHCNEGDVDFMLIMTSAWQKICFKHLRDETSADGQKIFKDFQALRILCESLTERWNIRWCRWSKDFRWWSRDFEESGRFIKRPLLERNSRCTNRD